MRDEDASELRALLHAEAENAPRPSGMTRANLRRAHVRRKVVVSVAMLGVLVAGTAVGGAATWIADGRDRGRVPVGPAPQPSEPSGKIAFSRFSSDGGLFVMNGDGSGVAKVADSVGRALDEAAWSPEGHRIAFHGFYGEAANEAGGLFAIDADGSELELLELGGGSPAWSPDGTEIAFSSGGDLRVIGSDGGRSRLLVEHGEGTGNADFPDWSPDGERIAFSQGGISVVNADGTGVQEIVGEEDDDTLLEPRWSPDGSEIAFTAHPHDGADGTIEIVAADGSERRTLTRGASPAWSPDGTRIAFERLDGDVSHIYSVRVDGTDLRQLTFGPDSDHSPDWTSIAPVYGDCRVTMPDRPGFIAPEPFPSQPPDLYDAVWYGTAELWTMLHPEGEVWSDLPEEDERFTQKLLFWSEDYPPEAGVSASLTLRGRQLDGPGSFETRGGGGQRGDLGSFMVVLFALRAGCWEITAEYRGAELSYVVFVDD